MITWLCFVGTTFISLFWFLGRADLQFDAFRIDCYTLGHWLNNALWIYSYGHWFRFNFGNRYQFISFWPLYIAFVFFDLNSISSCFRVTLFLFRNFISYRASLWIFITDLVLIHLIRIKGSDSTFFFTLVTSA
jgi:hypothetical protein